MFIVIFACALLVASTSLLHYEVLRALNVGLPGLAIPNRTKLLVVIIATFVTHAIEMAMYGAALYLLITWFDVGSLSGVAGFSLSTCMYFSAETYTSLGFGDLTPVGPIRLLAGVEALNGLLLIGWSASFTYISMERFWSDGRPET
jgi:Ion channel